MKKTKKKFILNVIISYSENVNPINFREPIYSIFRQLSWLHRLDYSIDMSTEIFDNIPPKTKTITDIIYLRSSEKTGVILRDFQKIIDTIFNYSLVTIFSGVDLFYQNQVYTKRFPFPSEFYRPLNYPYVEQYKGDNKTLCIYKDALGFDLDILLPNEN